MEPLVVMVVIRHIALVDHTLLNSLRDSFPLLLDLQVYLQVDLQDMGLRYPPALAVAPKHLVHLGKMEALDHLVKTEALVHLGIMEALDRQEIMEALDHLVKMEALDHLGIMKALDHQEIMEALDHQ